MARIVVDLKQQGDAFRVELQKIADLPDNAFEIRLRRKDGSLQNVNLPNLDAHRVKARGFLNTTPPITSLPADDLWCDTVFFLAFELPE